MKYTYQINLNNHFKNGWTILIYLIIFSLLPIYMVYRFGFEDIFLFILMSLLAFLIFFIPLLILHCNYYLKNSGDIFMYEPISRRITIIQKGKSVSFLFNDITLINQVKSYPLAENRMQWFPWDSYNYSIIQLKNGQQIVITSLLVPKLDLPIEHKKIKLDKKFYPIIGSVSEQLVKI